jgi:hypothetical protein
LSITVIAQIKKKKKIADTVKENIGGKYFCGQKTTLFLPQCLPKFKRALWGDKPEGLLPENCPNFSFFLFGPGPFGHL